MREYVIVSFSYSLCFSFSPQNILAQTKETNDVDDDDNDNEKNKKEQKKRADEMYHKNIYTHGLNDR